jgi:hypothetical protein
VTREQWRAVWRWMRVEKKRIAWECGPRFPEAPLVLDFSRPMPPRAPLPLGVIRL